MRFAVLVFNLGGPESLSEVKPFLYRLFSDPEIISIKWGPLRKAVAYLIATLRQRKSQGYYSQIGGGSPLRKLTEEQAAALAKELKDRGRDAEVFVGMCTSRPLLSEAMSQIARTDIQRLVILPLFPQYSYTTTRSGFTAIQQLIGQNPHFRDVEILWIDHWANNPTFIESHSLAIERELAKVERPHSVHILFSAHSIPESKVREGDPYLEQTKACVELIMDRLGRKNAYGLSFQSRIGPVKWLAPMTNDVLMELGGKGTRDVLVVPISFVSEHIETLYELDILYKKVAHKAGVANFRRVPALNSDPVFVRALADIVESSLQ